MTQGDKYRKNNATTKAIVDKMVNFRSEQHYDFRHLHSSQESVFERFHGEQQPLQPSLEKESACMKKIMQYLIDKGTKED